MIEEDVGEPKQHSPIKDPFGVEKNKVVPPVDKNLLKEALKFRGEGFHNYGYASMAVGKMFKSPRGSKCKIPKKKERPKDYGDYFARILYDYCLGDGESKSSKGQSTQKKNTSVLTEEAL